MRSVLCSVVLCSVSRFAAAQELRVAAATGNQHHPVLGHMRGMSVSVGLPMSKYSQLRVGFDALNGMQDRLGNACVGLHCVGSDTISEPMHDRSSLRGVMLGFSADVVRTTFVSASVVPSVHLVKVRADSHGATSQRSYRGDATLHGIQIDGEVQLHPPRIAWLSAYLGAGYGIVAAGDAKAYGEYSPFQRGWAFRRVALGATLHRVRPPPAPPDVD